MHTIWFSPWFQILRILKYCSDPKPKFICSLVHMFKDSQLMDKNLFFPLLKFCQCQYFWGIVQQCIFSYYDHQIKSQTNGSTEPYDTISVAATNLQRKNVKESQVDCTHKPWSKWMAGFGKIFFCLITTISVLHINAVHYHQTCQIDDLKLWTSLLVCVSL